MWLWNNHENYTMDKVNHTTGYGDIHKNQFSIESMEAFIGSVLRFSSKLYGSTVFQIRVTAKWRNSQIVNNAKTMYHNIT
jgi:hypothetical protein